MPEFKSAPIFAVKLRAVHNDAAFTMTKTADSSKFPIPSSLQDLERAPYNLLPYPDDFEDDDEASRADSFDSLVKLLETGNHTLLNGSSALFEADDAEDEEF